MMNPAIKTILDLLNSLQGQQKLNQHRYALSQLLMSINMEDESYEEYSLLTKLNQIDFQKVLANCK